jgi:colicin import membrane protein
MRARVSAHASLLLSSGTGTAPIGWYVAASLVVHVLFFVIVTYLPALAPKREFVPSVIMVNMVTMSPTGSIGKPGHSGPEKPEPKSEKPAAPDPGPAKPEVQESKPEPPAPKPAKPEIHEPKPVPPAPKPEKVSVPEPQPKAEPEKSADVISLSNEKAKPKTSLKKETFKSNQAIKNALNKIEKQVEESSPVDPLASALERLKSKVAKTESETAKNASKEPASGKSSGVGSGSGANGGSGGGTGGTGGTGAFGIQPIDFYRSLIPSHIEHNWVFNEQLVGGRTDLVSVIVVKIMKNGEITDIWFEKKSGNTYFDDSVFKAVKKSSPLPPLPREYTQPYYELGLIFTPKGLKRS